MRYSALKNAAANLVRGGATAAVALVLPRFLARSLDAEHFSAWSLILQIAAYASYLDFGLQLAVARFIAQALELGEEERQARVVNTALVLLSALAVLGFFVLGLAIAFLPHLFRGISMGLIPDFRTAALVLSLSACLLLPLSTYTGVLIGARRNEIPALAIGGSRVVGALAAIAVAHTTQSLALLALSVALPNLAGGVLQMAAVHWLTKASHARVRHVSKQVAQELLRFCTGLAVWSFAMLFISGLDVSIVAHFQFAAVGFYSLAATLITFLAGLTNAALSAIMAPVAALHARGESRKIAGIVITTTRLTVGVNCAITAIIFLCGENLLNAWVGPIYAAKALPVVKVLAAAQTIRLALAPYSVMLISIGEQNKNIAGAVCEAVLNFGASICGMVLFGPIGVAWGTFAGAVCGALWLLLRIMRTVTEVRVSADDFLRRAVLPALVPLLPWLLLLCLRRLQQTARNPAFTVLAVALVVLSAGAFVRRTFSQKRSQQS